MTPNRRKFTPEIATSRHALPTSQWPRVEEGYSGEGGGHFMKSTGYYQFSNWDEQEGLHFVLLRLGPLYATNWKWRLGFRIPVSFEEDTIMKIGRRGVCSWFSEYFLPYAHDGFGNNCNILHKIILSWSHLATHFPVFQYGAKKMILNLLRLGVVWFKFLFSK